MVQEGTHPSRVYGLLYAADGSIEDRFFGEGIDPTRVLPVRMRLPDGLGWIVADRGAALQYRSSNVGDGHIVITSDRAAARTDS